MKTIDIAPQKAVKVQ